MISFFDLFWLWPFHVWFEGRTCNLSYYWMSSTVFIWCNYCKLISCLQICRGVGNRKSTESNTNVSVSCLMAFLSCYILFVCVVVLVGMIQAWLCSSLIFVPLHVDGGYRSQSYMFFTHIHSQKTVCSQMDWVISGDTVWSIHILTCIVCKFKPFWSHDFRVYSEEFCIWIWGIVYLLVLQGWPAHVNFFGDSVTIEKVLCSVSF